MRSFLLTVFVLAMSHVGLAVDEEKGLPDQAKAHPETFDWKAYLDADISVSGQMTRAEGGVKLLSARTEEILAGYRQRLQARHDDEELQLLEQMQAQWQKSADAEVAFIASPWKGGSGARAAFPRARLECQVRHVKDLLEMEARCMALNK